MKWALEEGGGLISAVLAVTIFLLVTGLITSAILGGGSSISKAEESVEPIVSAINSMPNNKPMKMKLSLARGVAVLGFSSGDHIIINRKFIGAVKISSLIKEHPTLSDGCSPSESCICVAKSRSFKIARCYRLNKTIKFIYFNKTNSNLDANEGDNIKGKPELSYLVIATSSTNSNNYLLQIVRDKNAVYVSIPKTEHT